MTKKEYCTKCGKSFSRKYFKKHQRLCKGTNLDSEKSTTNNTSGKEVLQLFEDKVSLQRF